MGVDASIAMGVKTPRLDSPMNALAQMMQIQGVQRQNQLGQMQMDKYQQDVGENNRLNALYSGALGQDGKIDRAKLLSGAASGGLGSKIPGLQKGFLDEDEQRGKVSKQAVDLLESAAKQSRSYLETVTTPEQYLAWHEGNHKDPVLGPALAARGVTAETARASIMQALQSPGGLQELIKKSALGIEKFTELNKPTFQTRNTGGTTDTLQLPGLGGAPSVVNSIKNTQSPESIASIATQQRGQNMTDSRARAGQAQSASQHAATLGVKQQALGLKQAGSNKPLPVGALKMRVEAQDAADTADGVNERLANVEKRISGGKLSFGPVENVVSQGLNMAGVSTEKSRNFASFKSEMEKLRNDSLRLNKGVQTDGDAQRAWNELFQNINDTKLVQQRLTEIKQINARAKNLRLMEVDTIDRNYGRPGNAAPAQKSVLDEADAILNGE